MRNAGRSRRQPATSADVARLAGVSRSAVSRTFTDGASVSEPTRLKVLEAARKLKYRPNLFARSLKTRRSNILGLAISALDNQFYPDIVQRFSEEFEKLGLRLLLFVTHGGTGHDPLLDELLKYRLDGLILASSSVSSALAEECLRAGVPVVMFNNVDPASNVPTIECTNELGARTVAEFLIAGKHRRFGFIAGLPNDSTSYQRERAFARCLREKGLPEPNREEGEFTFAGAVRASRTLLKLKQPPDAIFCTNDHMALAALQVAREEFGLVPGENISIVGFDNAPIAQWPCFGLTTYAQPTADLVSRTIRVMQLSLENELPRKLHEQLPGELVVRTSARVPHSGVIHTADGMRIWRIPTTHHAHR
jgi:DNA-binding LacI/PurR family transcriptional regulator